MWQIGDVVSIEAAMNPGGDQKCNEIKNRRSHFIGAYSYLS
jgi:hypothetical protein